MRVLLFAATQLDEAVMERCVTLGQTVGTRFGALVRQVVVAFFVALLLCGEGTACTENGKPAAPTPNTLSEPPRPRPILRRIGAVLAGMLAVFILSIATDMVLHATGVFPPWGQPMGDSLFLLATAYRIVYGVAGGYVAARLAPDRPVQHALVYGVVGLALSIAGAVAMWDAGPAWYSLVLIGTAMPCAWAGGRLRGMQLPR